VLRGLYFTHARVTDQQAPQCHHQVADEPRLVAALGDALATT